MEHVYKLNINNLRTRLFSSAMKAAIFMTKHADQNHMKLLRINRYPGNVAVELRREGHIKIAAVEAGSHKFYPVDGRTDLYLVGKFYYEITKEEVD